MKLCRREGKEAALTLVEVVVTSVVIAVVIGMVLPGLNRRHDRRRGYCSNNLKQVGLAFRIFATDNDDLFPVNLSTNKGGSLEFVPTGNTFRHFQVMSNELSTPSVLICPEDKQRTSATNWATLSNSHVSYFVGFDSSEVEPQSLLAGDRNITNGVIPAGPILILRTNRLVGWTGEIHKQAGHVVLGDSSVRQLTSPQLREQLKDAEKPFQRVAIP